MSGPLPWSCLLPLLIAVATQSPSPGQQNAPSAAPPALRFGTLHERHVVQASVQLEWGEGVTGDVEVTAPPFVRVLRQQPDRLVLALDTGDVGPRQGAVEVRRGGRTLTVAVDAVVLPRVPGQTRLLVANGPFHAQSTDDDATFDPWRRVVAVGKLQPHYLVGATDGNWFDVDLLQRVDVVLLCEDALLSVSDHDVDLLQGFVCGGGRVVVCASPFYVGTVARANELVDAFGLRFCDEEVAPGAVVRAEGAAIAADRLTAGVGAVGWRRPSPIELRDDRARALVTLDCYQGRPSVALSRTESGGEIVALAAPLWWTWIGEEADNARLLQNVLTRAPR